MTDRMTDSEIVKALKELFEVMLYDGDLQRASTISHTIDLINRQKAEIERYKAALPDLEYQDDDFCGVLCYFAEGIINRQKEEIERLKSHIQEGIDLAKQLPEALKLSQNESIKEFAERFRQKMIDGGLYLAFIKNKLEETEKEMVGDGV